MIVATKVTASAIAPSVAAITPMIQKSIPTPGDADEPDSG
jgi:hypothetical protein